MSNTEKHWATWVLDIVVGVGALAQVVIGVILIWQLKAYEASNELTRESLELGKKNLALTAKSVDLTQQSMTLSQKSLDLTQKSLEATQQALKISQDANAISEKGMAAANTPWIDVRIDDVSYQGNHPFNSVLDELPPNNGVLGVGSADGPISNSAAQIHYSLENHSDSPAKHVYVSCFFQNAPEYADTGFMGGSNVAVMPKQTVQLIARMLTTSGKDPKEVIGRIKHAQVGIEMYVFYFDALKHRTGFIETFHDLDGKFVVTNTEFDPPEKEITDMIYGRDKPSEHWQ